MANTILLKRSDVANSVPAAGNLVPGEVALNFADGNLFFKNSSSEVVLLSSTQFVDVSGNVSGNFILGNGSQLTGINTFSTISVAGQSNVVADSIADTLTFAAGSGIALLTDVANNSITIATYGFDVNSIFATGGDMDTVEEAVTAEEDLGSITDSIIEAYDLGIAVTIDSFGIIAVTGQSSLIAESVADTLTFAAGSGVALVTNAATNTITIAAIGEGDSIFATGGNMDTIIIDATVEEDLGLITTGVLETYDLGTFVLGGVIFPDQLVLPSFTVTQLANTSTAPAGQMVFVTNESGGSVPAFSDGTNWRRVTDREVVT